MRTYKTELVDVDAKPRRGTFRDDDIIIMYAVWNLIKKSSSQHDLLRFMGQTGTGKSQVRPKHSNL